MKLYPSPPKKKNEGRDIAALSTTEKVTRVIALTVAFVTVYYFFFKILFF